MGGKNQTRLLSITVAIATTKDYTAEDGDLTADITVTAVGDDLICWPIYLYGSSFKFLLL